MAFERERQQMIADIESGVIATRSMTGRDRLDPRVLEAMRDVPREEFVPDDLRRSAFRDGALPVGHGQTISQPYMVAIMTDLLELTPHSVVLEIGTGTGYQAAILAQLARQVYSVERIPELARAAQLRLSGMGYDNIEIRCSDGYQGWPEKAPFEAIVVTAAAADVPPALLQQLGPAGRMVIPIGLPYSHQELRLLSRDSDGQLHSSNLLGVAFVPMIEDT